MKRSMKRCLIILLVLAFSACTVAPQTSPTPKVAYLQSCPNGLRIVAHVWSVAGIGADHQKEFWGLRALAEARNTRVATDPAGYRGDDVSRTLGGRLREAGEGRAKVNFDLAMVYRDSAGRVAGPLGSMRVERGIGLITLVGDPRPNGWILETIWPAHLISPVKSGDERRLWLSSDEWGNRCEKNIHGFVA